VDWDGVEEMEKLWGWNGVIFFTCVDPDKKDEGNFMGFGWEHCMWMG